ncbi:MAG: Na+/H+ antiporter NhaC family protein [Clostridia bacterium]|nr:Na+/H+ antiporter NhaC family protein [Clostridia bacterium]
MFINMISAAGDYFVGTFWAFVPAIIAIVLALITKQVYLSLFAGIFTGAMFLAGGNPLEAISNLFITMANQLGGNGGILIFLVILGIFAVLMVKTGGSKAYGEWAATKIKTKHGAELATIGLGALIFVDDYFNCLTVGSAMRPVTDKHKISHAKLAYLIDATAAPICIIAPISSWAAAVSGYADGGIIAFIKTIPFNMYALLTIGFMVVTVLLKLDFFKMKRNEKIAKETGDLYAGETDLPTEDVKTDDSIKGKVRNLVFPIVTLIVCCVGSMIFNGYYYDWDAGTIGRTLQSSNVLEAFSNCDAGSALALGSFIALVITLIFYYATKALTFKASMESIVDGFKSMVPAILILTFAWTLGGIMGAKGEGVDEFNKAVIDGTLNAKAFVQANITADSMALGVIPFVFFILACLLSFATGTSWGTFAVLIPISTAVMSASSSEGLFFLTMSAVLAGAVYGDHVSPISDTTIMASSGAQCNHIDHVKTQFPYATIVAVIAGITYLITGFISATSVGENYGASAGITLGVGFVLLAGTLFVLYILDRKGIADKIENAFAGVVAKISKKNIALEDTIAGGHEVSDQIDEAQVLTENNDEEAE